MSQDEAPQLTFDRELRLEVARVLRDLIFQRAPMQSRLLAYLAEHTITGTRPPTQYEIAVDGLGKDADYDVEHDSYPRVQISRLRRNLDNYYARNLPGNGLRIQIDQGSYRLMLERVATMAPNDAPTSPPAPSDTRPDPPVRMSASRGRALAMASVAIVALVLIAFGLLRGQPDAQHPARPTTALMMNATLPIANGAVGPSQIGAMEIIANRQLENSFVSSPAPGRTKGILPDYLVKLTLSEKNGRPVMLVSLSDKEGTIIYTDDVFLLDRQGKFSSAEMEAALVYMTSPTGKIARNELKRVDEPDSSDYACFLSVENHRARGKETAELVDRCLAAFPASDFRPFWHARRAFAFYQAKASRREPITKSGYGWSELRTALEIDEFNAFANFVASKVELATGNCANARMYIDRALTRGSSYPTMVASVQANSLACVTSPPNSLVEAEKMRALADFNSNPDPLLHAHLMLALIASGDRDGAAEIAGRLVIEKPTGPVETMSQLLRRSLEDPRAARSDRRALRDAVYSLLWHERATDTIVENILG